MGPIRVNQPQCGVGDFLHLYDSHFLKFKVGLQFDKVNGFETSHILSCKNIGFKEFKSLATPK